MQLSREQRRRDARAASRQPRRLQRAIRLGIALLAGATYANWIPLVQEWCTVHQPLEGMRIGHSLQWLTLQLGQHELALETA